MVNGHICIFVCMTTRSIHLELCYDHQGGEGLSTSIFLLAFRRFVCIRGIQSSVIFSDQGPNFMAAIKQIKETADQWNAILSEELANIPEGKFEWITNCPSASHMNGCTERLVRWVRKAIGVSLNYHLKQFLES